MEPVAIFLQPRAQNPTGASMTPERVAALAALLQHTRTWVIEADHSGLIARGADVSLGTFLPDRTVHVRSFSKSHSPDLRTAAIGGAAEVLDPLMARRMLGPGWTSRILQGMLVHLLSDPAAIAAVDRARDAYHHRVSGLHEALTKRGVICAPADGINLWVQVADERSALLMLAAGGIRVAPGAPFMVQPLADAYLRITAGLLPDDSAQIDDIGRRIAEAALARPSVRGGIS